VAERPRITIDRAKFRRHIQHRVAGLTNEAAVMVQRETMRLLNQRSSRGKYGRSSPGEPPHKDTGTLARSIEIDEATPEVPVAHVGSNLAYARILEYGGTIRPKHAKALSIPVNAQARKLRSPRHNSRLFMVKPRGGPPLLVKQIGGKKSRTEVWFVLKKSVTIAARPYLRPAFENMRGAIQALVTPQRLMAGFGREG
jgi:phage gpG-like protein